MAGLGKCKVDEAVEELIHLLTAERHLTADRHTLTNLEVSDRLLCLSWLLLIFQT